jgi:hypothetical protein
VLLRAVALLGLVRLLHREARAPWPGRCGASAVRRRTPAPWECGAPVRSAARNGLARQSNRGMIGRCRTARQTSAPPVAGPWRHR